MLLHPFDGDDFLVNMAKQVVWLFHPTTWSQLFCPLCPLAQMWVVLLAVGALAWRATDGTRPALLLALVSAAVCPVAELGLEHFLGLWHYPRADFFVGA